MIRIMKRLLPVLMVLLASTASRSAEFLLVADSGNDRVLLLDAFDGSVVDENFIVESSANELSTPKNAIDSGRGTIFVADQLTDGVYEYAPDGTFLGVFADSGDGLDNIRGITVREGVLYVTVGGDNGGLGDTIQRFDVASGSSLGTWTDEELSSPFDLLFRADDVLISDSSTDNVERYDLDGNHLGTLIQGDPNFGIDFPQQIHETSTSSLLVAGFSVPAGIYEYQADGTPIGVYARDLGIRGVFELGNGLILFTVGPEILTVDRGTGTIETIYSGGSFQYIEAFSFPSSGVIPEPSTVVLLGSGLVGLGALAIRRRLVRAGRLAG